MGNSKNKKLKTITSEHVHVRLIQNMIDVTKVNFKMLKIKSSFIYYKITQIFD